jgi:hypothetical protein
MEKVKRVRADGPGVVKDGHGGLDRARDRGPKDGPWMASTWGCR